MASQQTSSSTNASRETAWSNYFAALGADPEMSQRLGQRQCRRERHWDRVGLEPAESENLASMLTLHDLDKHLGRAGPHGAEPSLQRLIHLTVLHFERTRCWTLSARLGHKQACREVRLCDAGIDVYVAQSYAHRETEWEARNGASEGEPRNDE